MLSISDHALSNTVQLTDPDTERGYTLCKALEILVAIDDDDSNSLHSTLERLMDPPVVRFAQKYEMKILIAAMKAYLFNSVTQYPPEGGEHILAAAVLGEWALCGRLIATLDHNMYNDPTAVAMMRQRMDWRGWTQGDVWELTKVDPKFAWAICRAGTKHAGVKKDRRINYEGMGEDVAKRMMWSVHSHPLKLSADMTRDHDQAEDWADSWVLPGETWWNED